MKQLLQVTEPVLKNTKNQLKAGTTLCLALLLFTLNSYAQTSTEQFETESHGSSSFTDNGVIFNIISHTGTFDIQANYPGTGWNGTSADNRYIDNADDVANPPSFSIKTTSNLFKVNRFWMYLSKLNLDLNATGTLTITGKLSGITKFTQIKTTGFATSLGSTNGYTLIDMTNLNGQNYSNIVIDQLQITLSGEFRYARFDAFTWVKDSNIILPVTLTDFTSKIEGNFAKLEWQTASENSNKEFVIYRSGDGKSFKELDKVAGKGNSNGKKEYFYYDRNPLPGNNYYKLVQVDHNGETTELGVKFVSFDIAASLHLYPNPTSKIVKLSGETSGRYDLLDNSGRKLRSGDANELRSGIDVAHLPTGQYHISIGSKSFKFIKQ